MLCLERVPRKACAIGIRVYGRMCTSTRMTSFYILIKGVMKKRTYHQSSVIPQIDSD